MSDQVQSVAAETRETINQAINDPKVKEHCAIVAKELESIFKNKWFGITQIIKKTTFKQPRSATDIMQVLIFLGLAYQDVTERGQIRYKVTLAKEARLVVLKNELELAQGKVTDIITQINGLESE